MRSSTSQQAAACKASSRGCPLEFRIFLFSTPVERTADDGFACDGRLIRAGLVAGDVGRGTGEHWWRRPPFNRIWFPRRFALLANAALALLRALWKPR